jgi:hypothetical protein
MGRHAEGASKGCRMARRSAALSGPIRIWPDFQGFAPLTPWLSLSSLRDGNATRPSPLAANPVHRPIITKGPLFSEAFTSRDPIEVAHPLHK